MPSHAGPPSRGPEWMRRAEMAYAFSVRNAHSSQVPTGEKFIVTETDQDVRFGWVVTVPRRTRARGWGRTLRGSIPGQPPRKPPPNAARAADYPPWYVLLLWEMAILFPFPVKNPGKSRSGSLFGRTAPTKTPPTPPWHGGGTPSPGRQRPPHRVIAVAPCERVPGGLGSR